MKFRNVVFANKLIHVYLTPFIVHPEEIQKIVTPTDTSADIDGAELKRVYNLLGFDGEKEVKKIDYDLADTLSRMYHKFSDNL